MTQRERDPSTPSHTATEGRHRMRDTDPHTRTDLITIAVGAAALVGMRSAARSELTDLETSGSSRRSTNFRRDTTRSVAVMQYGTFITIPVLTLIAFAFRRFRLGWALLLAGTSVYLLALVETGRRARTPRMAPQGGRDARTVRRREPRVPVGARGGGRCPHRGGGGASVETLGDRGGDPGRVVVFGRMYVGAHLPLDLVGGAALGAIAGGVANLLIPPRPRQQPEERASTTANRDADPLPLASDRIRIGSW